MFKRIFLFLAINCLVVLTISVVLSLLNVKPYLTAHGLDLRALLIFCLIWGMVGALISLLLSRKIAKWLMHVQLIDGRGSHAKLYQMVEKLARDAGLSTTPEVGIFSSPEMNAFATGASKRRSLVAVSTALLAQMNEHELHAVLGHEISHIANGDMVTMTLIQGVVNAFVMFLARVAAFAISSMGRGGRNSRSSYSSYYLTTFLFEILFMIMGSVVIASFSRRREFRADRGAAILSRREHMIAALEKLRAAKMQRSKRSSMSAMMIMMPNRMGFSRLFATHPSIEARIKKLKELTFN